MKNLVKVIQEIKNIAKMEPTRILYIYQEICPYTPETMAATICRELPQLMQETGNYEVRVFVPCFGLINERRNQLHEVQRLSGLNLIVDEDDHQLIVKVASIQSARLQIYFIDNEEYFGRKAMNTDEAGKVFKDNDERMIFYSRGVLETIKKLRWTPDIIHCHGSLTALAPLYIRTLYRKDPFYKDKKVVFSVYNDKFENKINPKLKSKLNIAEADKIFADKDITWELLMSMAGEFSDVVVEGEEGVDAITKGLFDTKKVKYEKHQPDMIALYEKIYDGLRTEK